MLPESCSPLRWRYVTLPLPHPPPHPVARVTLLFEKSLSRTPLGPGQGPCVSLVFYLLCGLFFGGVFGFPWISESVFLLAVALDSAVTVLRGFSSIIVTLTCC